MSALARVAFAFFLGVAQLPAALAQDSATAPAAVASDLLPFASDEGLARLVRSDAKVNFPALANEFEAEYNGAFCGPASAAIVLNAVHGPSPDLPKDWSRFRPEDLRYVRVALDPVLPRFTQDNVIDKGAKTRAQVFGEPVSLNGRMVNDPGYQVRQLDKMLRANGLVTRLVIVDDSKSEQNIRNDLVANLKHRGDYVIVAYSRRAVGQQGNGHISPLGAYDAQSDSFLVLDVNAARYGWVWMPTSTLTKGMRTFYMVENLGYILVEPH